jgi:hypothetical protein
MFVPANKREPRKFRISRRNRAGYEAKNGFCLSELATSFRGGLGRADIIGFQRRHRKVLEQDG